MNEKTCGAKLRGKDDRCRSTVISVNGRCRLHGGKAPTGIASARFKHGRFSKYMPADIRGRYGALVGDASLTKLRDEIAVVTVAIEQKLERLYAGESQGLWAKANAIWQKYLQMGADHEANPDAEHDLDTVREQLTETLAAGRTTFDLVAELGPELELKRKLTETENRREKQVAETLSADEALAFVRQLTDSIKRNVSNPNEIAAIAADFDRALRR